MSDLSITAASVVAGDGATIARGTAGASLTAGQAIYLDAASNKMKLADANGAAALRFVRGIALHAAADGQPISYISEGPLNIGATLTVGEIYVLSATAGGVAPKGDLATGHGVSIVGVATSASNIAVNINNSGATVP